MEGIATLLSIAAFVATWWWFNKIGKKHGWKAFYRYLMGPLSGTIAFLCVLLLLMPKPATHSSEKVKEKIDASASTQVASSDEAVEADGGSYSTAKDGTADEIHALAEESLEFMDKTRQTIDFAVAASDGEAIRNEVDRPSWKMIMRWNDYTYRSYHAYVSCYDALQAMNSYASRLVQADSADRRRGLDYNAKQYDANLSKCQDAVSSKGRIRSDDE